METWREKFENRITTIILSTLAVELLLLVVMIALIYNEMSAKYIFYVFSIVVLIASTIYFAWHSLIKENAFELIAFLIMSSILNFHGIYMAVLHGKPLLFTAISSLILSVCQLFYYFTFYFAYRKFGWRIVNAIKNTDAKVITAFKVYETFISVIKLDFLLYTLTVATFIYYIAVNWNSFILGGMVISLIFYAFMISYSILGVFGVTKENRCLLFSFLGLLPILAGVKLFLLVAIAAAPGKNIDRFILSQAIVIAIVDLIIACTMEVLGVICSQSFGLGLGAILRRNSEVLKTFI
ncbi:unnamed protein product [Blepharisma stoltei]|uniref:Uncharacterized protein n=1 Tax=Blepharisma stoltei TaxID=1481888 RepID=A0AAU9JNZ2_9CILI|nr:unnamed protein product [Blepharisma stoltei]